MHLAFLTPEYPHPRSTTSGGLGTSIKNLAHQLLLRNIKVTVVVYGQKEDLIFEENGISFHFIRRRKYKFLGWYLHRKFLQTYLNKIIISKKIDAVEAPDWTGISAFIKLKCLLILRMNGSDTYFCNLENRPQKKKNFFFEKVALKGADYLISVSNFTARKTAKLFELNREITVIPNAVNVQIFQSSDGPIEAHSILYFGSIIRKKGVLELASIFEKVHKEKPEARLIMTGKDVPDIKTGRSTKEIFLEELSTSALQKVECRGDLSYEAVKKEIAKAAVVVLPSFAEALPMAWLEAMAMEKALVTSNIGWANEVMIEGKTGFMVNPRNHQEYAEKILLLLKDPSLAQKMGTAARKQVLEKFSAEKVAEENLNFYKSILQKDIQKNHPKL